MPFLTELGQRAAVLAQEREAILSTKLRAEGLVQVDPTRIEQLVLILVDNAAKYSPPGKQITLHSAITNGELLIEVADQGVGIPKADLPLIFERFYRVDKARARKQGGSGLGLSIAKRIVEKHSGRIEAESQLNVGTTMRFYLPLVVMAQQTTTSYSTIGGRLDAPSPSHIKNR
jgi:two-component system sensor histidine kinase VicK